MGVKILLSIVIVGISIVDCCENTYIVDVDTGIDDFQALTFLLNAKQRGKLNIAAIILTDGNAALNDVKNNTARLLDIVREKQIPIFAGSAGRILRERHADNWFGVDGFGDLNLPKPPQKIRDVIAPTAIANLLRDRPGLRYVVLGPMTNLALALIMYEDVADNIGKIYIMGGNYGEDGAEFNFLSDPAAAHIVLKKAKQNVTMFPFQACSTEEITYGWRFGIKLNNSVWNLVEAAEKNVFGKMDPNGRYTPCDAILASILIEQKISGPTINVNAYVGIGDNNFGQVIINSTSMKPPNVIMIENYDVNAYKKFFVDEFSEVCNLHDCRRKYKKLIKTQLNKIIE